MHLYCSHNTFLTQHTYITIFPVLIEVFTPLAPSVSLPHANIIQGKYQYTEDLLSIDAHRRPTQPHLPRDCYTVQSPLTVTTWCSYLSSHPDQRFAQYMINGITNIGFNYTSTLVPARRNMSSTKINAKVVDDYIQEELDSRRLITIPHDSIPGIQLSPFGVTPKRGQSNKWRLIVDLSSPRGYSVNDGIPSMRPLTSYINWVLVH